MLLLYLISSKKHYLDKMDSKLLNLVCLGRERLAQHLGGYKVSCSMLNSNQS